jgi:protein TonB
LLLAAAAPGANPSAPQLLNLPELVTSEDYPRVSLLNSEEGTVEVELKVDRTGLVTSCRVAKTSGHIALDEQTCAVFRARARFEPATDRRGRAVNSEYRQKVTWKVAGQAPTPMPRQAWMVRTTIALGSGGTFVDCKVESTGLSIAPPDCEPLMALARANAGQAPSLADIRGFAITEVYFYPVQTSSAPIPPKLTDATQVAEQVSDVIIAPDGQASTCNGIRYSGTATPELDACTLIRHYRFEAAPAGAVSLHGTVVVRAYARAHSVT